MGDLRKLWQAYKFKSEDEFKKAHAKELLSVDTKGVTGYPIKFDKDLGPALDKFEAATKAKKPADQQQARQKARVALAEYRKRVNEKKGILGGAAGPLETGIKEIDKRLG